MGLHLNLLRRRGGIFMIALALVMMTGTFSASQQARASKSAYVALPQSAARWIAGARYLGPHQKQAQITIGLLLRTSHPAEQQALMSALYNPRSAQYHQWLGTGAFAQRFAPAASDLASVRTFLSRAGMRLLDSSEPFFLLAQTSIVRAEAALHTTINDYQVADGQSYFANNSDVQLPASVRPAVVGVIGLSNFKAMRNNMMPVPHQAKKAGKAPTPPHYGGGVNGSGLTPSQIAGIYNAEPVYDQLHNLGQRATLAVFELSGYREDDITTYENQYHLPRPELKNIGVLGGASNDSGAGEAELDIELQVALAPAVDDILVYNGPNTEIGVLAEYMRIAKDNEADSISSSWGIPCEFGLNSEVSLVENQIFAQMAAQGQSFFAASGDAGAYGCSRSGLILPYPLSLQLSDPNNQPYNTAVGGTSFRTQQGGSINFDPGNNPHPSYPGTAFEHVWNRGCVQSDCSQGAGGGGVSRIWAEPDYAFDRVTGDPLPGVFEGGKSKSWIYCEQKLGVLCRENPDVSLDADPGTGYSVYCTDLGDSICATGDLGQPGWLLIGGTSCAAPLWAAIAALDITQHKARQGLYNYRVYPFDTPAGYAHELHDITIGDNGHYPAGPNYDMATGLGTPNIYALLKS